MKGILPKGFLTASDGGYFGKILATDGNEIRTLSLFYRIVPETSVPKDDNRSSS
jgi:hypothetical protein